jgi:hypothetical protein
MASIWNFIQFQVGWFGIVLNVAADQMLFAYLIAIAVFALHLMWVRNPIPELLLLAALAVVGWLWETLVLATGWIAYGDGGGQWAPLWLACLWANFATTLNHSLRWLQGRWLLAALFGAAGGPLAFFAGEKLGAAVFLEPGAMLILLAGGWLVLTPASVYTARRLRELVEACRHHKSGYSL